MYSYDAAGRLIQVIDPSGEVAQYVYDPAGNIVQIIRVPTGAVAISGFTPKSGPTGTIVTIYGAGFSATPANNTVKFNGTTANVTSAAVNQLVAVVPPGATTGPIAVTVGAQTATSAETFEVTSGSGGLPTITGFSPIWGLPGTPVTITGTNFDPVLIKNTVRFDGAQAAVTATVPTQIAANVPTYAGSGPITVKTPQGIAQSADDFIIPPSGYAYADIISRVRITMDGPSAPLSIGTANKHGMVLFDASAGDYVSVQLSSISVSPSGSVPFKVFDTTNTQILTGSISTSNASIHLPPLTRTGTYSIIFSPGAATASFTLALRRNAVMTVAQPVMNADVPGAGQSIRGTFAGTAGQSLTLRLSIASTSPADQAVTFALYKPDATLLVQATGQQSLDGAVLYSGSLPVTGTYRVIVQPAAPATGVMNVVLNPAMDIVADADPVSVTSSSGWRSKRILFAGTGGQNISFGLTGLGFTPASTGNAQLYIYKPDGQLLVLQANACYTSNPGSNCPNLQTGLPATGTYSLLIAPPSNVTSFTGTLTLSNLLTGTLVVATPYPVSIARAGQSAMLSFNGTAGQPAVFRLSVSGTSPENQNVTAALYRANGNFVSQVSGSSSSDGATLHIGSLPATETYTLYVVPAYSATGSMSVTANPAVDLAIDGSSLAAFNSVAGYARRYFFTATAGQRISVAMTSLGYNPSTSSNGTLRVYRPGGTLEGQTAFCSTGNPGANCQELQIVPPVSGLYEVTFTPPASRLFTGTLTLSNVISGTLTSGTPFSINATRPGHHAKLDFSGTVGQAATLRLGIASTTPANQNVGMSVSGPNGPVGSAMTGSPSSDGIVMHVGSLPATGTYSVYVTPWWNSIGSMALTLNPTMDLVVDDPSSNIATTTAGYKKRYLLSATAGQRIGIGTRDHVHTPSSGASTNIQLISPSGSTVDSINCTTSGVARCELNSTASVAGPHTVLVSPPAGVNFSGTITVSNFVTGSLTVGGGAIPATMDRDGQDGWYTFSGTAGQLLRLSISGMATTPSSQTVTFQIRRPNGSMLTYTTSSSASHNFDIQALDATGDHAVWISPWWGARFNANIAINPR